MERIPIDEEWFRGRLAVLGLEANDIAKAIDRNKSVVSRTLHGLRPIRCDEVKPIATLLGVSVEELLFRAGASTRLDSRQPRVPIRGIVNGRTARVHDNRDAQDSISAPTDLAESVAALKVVSGSSWIIGAFLLFDTADQGVNPAAVGRLAVCTLAQTNEMLIGKVTAVPGDYEVWHVDYLDGTADSAVPLTRATPILWIRP